MKQILIILLFTVILFGQTDQDLCKLSWLVGDWQSINRKVIIKETWFKSIGNTMTGLVRMIKDDQLFITQLQTIYSDSGKLTLKLKHFDSKFVAWEEKDEWILFPVKMISSDEIQFEGMNYSLKKNELIIAMSVKMKDGSLNNQAVTLKRLID